MANKIYLAKSYERYGEVHVEKVFQSKEIAEKYCEIQNKVETEDDISYHVEEREIDDELVDIITPVNKYHTYNICRYDYEDGAVRESEGEQQFIQSEKDSLIADLYDKGTHEVEIEVKSRISLEHAKEVARNVYRSHFSTENSTTLDLPQEAKNVIF